MTEQDPLFEAILSGNAPEARSLAERALADGQDPLAIVEKQMIPAMDEVGRRFECDEFFVPELLVAARAMKQALEIITPELVKAGVKARGRVVAGTVHGDLHDIGKNLVCSMLEGAGFEVTNLGVDVSPENFVEAVRDGNAQVVALSALLTTTMLAMRSTIEALAEAGVRDQVKVIVGGAAITQEYADEIGADGYSDNAAGAVTLVRELNAALVGTAG